MHASKTQIKQTCKLVKQCWNTRQHNTRLIYIYTILVISNYSPKARVHLNRNFKRVFLRISIKIGKYVLRRIRPMFYFRIELIFKFLKNLIGNESPEGIYLVKCLNLRRINWTVSLRLVHILKTRRLSKS